MGQMLQVVPSYIDRPGQGGVPQSCVVTDSSQGKAGSCKTWKENFDRENPQRFKNCFVL